MEKSLNERFNAIVSQIKKIEKEDNQAELEESMLKKEIAQQRAKLSEMGVEISGREDLKNKRDKSRQVLSDLLDSLEKKLKEYEYLKGSDENKEDSFDEDFGYYV